MNELDGVSHAIGRLQASVESQSVAHVAILQKLENVHLSIVTKIDSHDDDIAEIKKELAERRGALKVYAVVASIITGLFVRFVEQLPVMMR